MREFTLDARLAACAAFVRPGSRLADVGTDHGYLPIRLLLDGVVPFAIASDVRPGPLSSAKENAERYGVSEQMDCRLCDGLSDVLPGEADDVTIAGMGGELILRILKEAPWACEDNMRLILQPMTMAPELRRGLLELGMDITREIAVSAAGRVYSVICAEKPAQPICTCGERKRPAPYRQHRRGGQAFRPSGRAYKTLFVMGGRYDDSQRCV